MGLFNRLQNQPNKLTLEANGLLNQPTKPEVPTSNTPDPSAAPATDNTPKEKKSLPKQHWKRYVVIGGVAIGLLLLILAALTLTGLDLAVMQPYLTGRITSNNQPISGATVKIGNVSVSSEQDGNYTIPNLMPGQYDVEVVANGYETIKTRLTIARGYLTYANNQDFELMPSGATLVTGKIKVSDLGYQFLDDVIIVGDREFEIETDGSFKLLNLSSGRQTWEYRSIHYKDIKQTAELVQGVNDLGEFPTTPAGDLVASTRSYLTNATVTDLNVIVEGVEPEYISISTEGTLRIRDLEIAKQYRIQISHPQYETRQYVATTKQGESEILNFRVVEKGKVPFLRKIGADIHLMVSDYDGENAKQLTNEQYNPSHEYLDTTQVYFSSDKDRISSNIGSGRISIPYVASISTGTPQRVMNAFTNLGRVIPNYKAKKLLNIRRGDTTRARVLEIADIDGNNRRSLFAGSNITFNDVVLADTGRHLAFTLVDLDDDKRNGLYWSNTQNEAIRIVQKPNVVINDISANGDRILYTTTNTSTGISDLYMYIVSGGKDTLLRGSWRGLQVQFDGDAEDSLLFFELRDGASNIFRLNLVDNKETRLTNFTSGEGVEQISQQPGLIVYQTNRGLYVMHASNPLPGKLITTNFSKSSGG